MTNPDIKRSEQRVLNLAFDEELFALVVESGMYDGSSLKRQVGETTLRWDIDGTNIYIGQAPAGSLESGAVWQIIKYDTSAGSGKYADGNTDFDNVWADRKTTVTYS